MDKNGLTISRGAKIFVGWFTFKAQPQNKNKKTFVSLDYVFYISPPQPLQLRDVIARKFDIVLIVI